MQAFLDRLLGLRPDGPIHENLAARLERVGRRVGRPDLHRMTDDLVAADAGSALAAAALHELTVGETWFFRDRAALAALVERAPRAGPVRAWSAACSTGEETHSLAYLLRSRVGGPLEVVGTDIDRLRLAPAGARAYGPRSARGLPLPADFARRGPAGAVEVRELDGVRVTFRPHNLLTDPPPGLFDLVVCRNALLYMTRDARARALATLVASLREGGWLLLGPCDVLDDPGCVPGGLERPGHLPLFRRGPPTPAPPPPAAPASGRRLPVAPPPPAVRAPAPSPGPAERARLLALQAGAQAERGELDAAELTALLAADLDPDAPEPAAVLVRLALLRGEPRLARRILEAAARLHPAAAPLRGLREELDAAGGAHGGA
jgi:chemotaxis protein methyltransferase CheR